VKWERKFKATLLPNQVVVISIMIDDYERQVIRLGFRKLLEFFEFLKEVVEKARVKYGRKEPPYTIYYRVVEDKYGRTLWVTVVEFRKDIDVDKMAKLLSYITKLSVAKVGRCCVIKGYLLEKDVRKILDAIIG